MSDRYTPRDKRPIAPQRELQHQIGELQPGLGILSDYRSNPLPVTTEWPLVLLTRYNKSPDSLSKTERTAAENLRSVLEELRLAHRASRIPNRYVGPVFYEKRDGSVSLDPKFVREVLEPYKARAYKLAEKLSSPDRRGPFANLSSRLFRKFLDNDDSTAVLNGQHLVTEVDQVRRGVNNVEQHLLNWLKDSSKSGDANERFHYFLDALEPNDTMPIGSRWDSRVNMGIPIGDRDAQEIWGALNNFQVSGEGRGTLRKIDSNTYDVNLDVGISLNDTYDFTDDRNEAIANIGARWRAGWDRNIGDALSMPEIDLDKLNLLAQIGYAAPFKVESTKLAKRLTARIKKAVDANGTPTYQLESYQWLPKAYISH